MRITRRQFMLGALGVAAMGAGGAAYARYIEPRMIWRRVLDVPLNRDGWRGPLRVLHISDLHHSRVVPLSFIASGIQKGLSLRPDLICITGDFITKDLLEAEAYRRALARLPAYAPTFACLGNHDGGRWAGVRGGYGDTGTIRRLIHDSGIALLDNESRTVALKGQSVRITGVGDAWADELDTERAFASASQDADAHIVLSHNPDTKTNLAPYPWDLLLCGHTHGGQVQIPFMGAPIVPVHDTNMIEGLHPWRGRTIHITRGIGNLHGIRFNCPPEVNLLVVRGNEH